MVSGVGRKLRPGWIDSNERTGGKGEELTRMPTFACVPPGAFRPQTPEITSYGPSHRQALFLVDATQAPAFLRSPPRRQRNGRRCVQDEKSAPADDGSQIVGRSGSRSVEIQNTAIHQIRGFGLHEHIDPLSRLARESTSAHSMGPQRVIICRDPAHARHDGSRAVFRKGIHSARRTTNPRGPAPRSVYPAAARSPLRSGTCFRPGPVLQRCLRCYR